MKPNSHRRQETWLLGVALLGASLATGPAIAQTLAGAVATARPADSGDKVIEMSPFTVEASVKDVGYYAENTLAGSRMNSKITDLAAAISVVTAEQLRDTAAIDINDVFAYEANTEGTRNYSAVAIDSAGGVDDQIQRAPETANRVRGMGAPDFAVDYYAGLSGMPADAYNTQRFTINRGPNSVLFGLGTAAGIVNQTQARANLEKNSTTLTTRASSWDGYRASFGLNRVLLDHKLALYVAGLYDTRGYRLQPSYDRTKRYFGAVTFQPFKRTQLRVNYEHYENKNRRPNSFTPTDEITPWRQAGSPTWNAFTYQTTVNRVTSAPITNDALLPTGLFADTGYMRPAQFIDHGQIALWTVQRLGNNTLFGGLDSNPNLSNRMAYAASDIRRLRGTRYPLFSMVGITDKSLYDWDHVNAVSLNTAESAGSTLQLTFEQQLLRNLYFEAGYFRQEFKPITRNFLNGTMNILMPDVNERLVDGSPNPFFLRPYYQAGAPSEGRTPQTNEILRGQLGYALDFTGRAGWTKWFGRHRVLGLAEERDVETSTERYFEYVTTKTGWTNINPHVGPTAQKNVYRRYYVGPAGAGLAYAPGQVFWGGQTATFRSYRPTAVNSATGTWVDETLTTEAMLGLPGDSSQQRTISQSLTMQNFFWGDRLITTFGWRTDKNRSRRSEAVVVDPATYRVDPTNFHTYIKPWDRVEGTTTTKGVVFRPLSWLSLRYNESDNFRVSSLTYFLDGSVLPLPGGKGKDYGFGLSLLDNKLTAIFNWYESGQLGSYSGSGGTSAGRTMTIDSTFILPWIRDYLTRTEPAGTTAEQIATKALQLAKLPAEYAGQTASHAYSDTTDITSKGFELTLNYNLTQTWNVKFTAGQQKTIETNIGPRLAAWWAAREAVWKSLNLPEADGTIVNGYTGYGLGSLPSNGYDTVETWYQALAVAPFATAKLYEGKPRPQQREWRWSAITNHRFNQGLLKNAGVGGALRWEDKAAVSFRGTPGADGVIREYKGGPIYDDARYYVDLWTSYSKRLSDKTNLRVQLNVRNALERGGIRAVAYNPDGAPSVFRIIDPREFIFTLTFER